METSIVYWGYLGIMENGSYYLGFRGFGFTGFEIPGSGCVMVPWRDLPVEWLWAALCP